MIVVAYLLLQTEKLSPRALAYSGLNAMGAALILISLLVDFNLAAFIVEIFWLAVSCVGLYKWTTRTKGRSSQP